MRALSKSDLALEISFCAHLEKINEKILFFFFPPENVIQSDSCSQIPSCCALWRPAFRAD